MPLVLLSSIWAPSSPVKGWLCSPCLLLLPFCCYPLPLRHTVPLQSHMCTGPPILKAFQTITCLAIIMLAVSMRSFIHSRLSNLVIFKNYHSLGPSIGWAKWGTHQTWQKEFHPFRAIREKGPWFLFLICSATCYDSLSTSKRWPNICPESLLDWFPSHHSEFSLALIIFCNYQCCVLRFSPFFNALKIELKHFDLIFESFVSNNLSVGLVNKICEPF